MGIEDLLAAAASDASISGREDLAHFRLPPIRSGSPNANSSSLPPELQRLAFTPEEAAAAAHQRQRSSSSVLDANDLYSNAPASKLATLATLSTMDNWQPNFYDPRQRSLSNPKIDSRPSTSSSSYSGNGTLHRPPLQLQQHQQAQWQQPSSQPVDMNGPSAPWRYPNIAQSSRASYGLPAYPSYTAPFPSSAPPKTYDVAESIRESVDHLRRKQQALLNQTGEDAEAFNKFAPRSQRACVSSAL